MKYKKEVGEINDKFEELSDGMLDDVRGGVTDFPLNPGQSGSNNQVLNQQQNIGEDAVFNSPQKEEAP